jgi:hypothetical protein
VAPVRRRAPLRPIGERGGAGEGDRTVSELPPIEQHDYFMRLALREAERELAH